MKQIELKEMKAFPKHTYVIEISIIIVLISSGKVTYFTVLCEQYQPSLNRDPTYREYLDRIGQLFFNLPAPKPQAGPGGIFGKVFKFVTTSSYSDVILAGADINLTYTTRSFFFFILGAHVVEWL